MSFSDKIKILRRQELDAFIAQAFSPELMNAQYLQDLQVKSSFYSISFDIISVDWHLTCYWHIASTSDVARSATGYLVHGRYRDRTISKWRLRRTDSMVNVLPLALFRR